MSLFLSFIFLTLIGAGTAYMALKRGRDPYAWFAIGLFLGLLGLLILVLLPPLDAEKDKEGLLKNDDVVIASENQVVIVNEWFCLDNKKKQLGPLSFDELKQQWKDGNINDKSFVWCDGMATWKKIEEVPLLATLR